MAFTNLGFEDEEPADPGIPEFWTAGLVAIASSIAGYDDESADSDVVEDYEGGWSTNASYLFAYADPIDLGELESAIYDSALPLVESIEDFEEGWSTNQNYLFDLVSIAAASYDTTPQDFEDFTQEWSVNEFYFFTWEAVIAISGDEAASFDSGTPEDFEDFEEEWDTNESYDFTMGSTSAASYDGTSPEAFEDFEEVILEFAVTVVPGTDRVVATAHGLSTGQRISFRNEDGALPDGLNTGFLYFVIGATANDFQVSQTSGGAAVDITDNGVGTHFAIADQTLFWTSDLGVL